MRALGCRDFTAYYEHVAADGGERTAMLDCISTNETRFFREPQQFEFLEAVGAAAVARARRRRHDPETDPRLERRLLDRRGAVHAGDGAGSHFPAADGWSVEILASDLSTRVLAAARDGVWPVERSNDIPERLRKAYMLRGVRSEEGRMRAHPSLQSMIEFRRINLNDDNYGIRGTFDLIFCRNVLIYFDRESKERVIKRLIAPSRRRPAFSSSATPRASPPARSAWSTPARRSIAAPALSA